ncbi:uncharacterized protein [Vicugna pacos]|uniref:Basic proline-rich protein-like n=1 Tax=Vicugna pacos TaxID=30538 RepID=A0ABM5CSI4_VICPA
MDGSCFPPRSLSERTRPQRFSPFTASGPGGAPVRNGSDFPAQEAEETQVTHVGPGPAPALAGSSRPPAAAPEAQVTLQRPGVCRDRPVLPPAPGPPLGPVQPRSPVPDAPLAHVGPGPAPALAGSSRPPAAAPEAQVTLQRPGVCRDRPVLPPAPGPPLGPVQPRSPVPDAPLAHVGPGPAPALAGSSRPPAAAPEAQVTLQRPGVCRDRPVLPPAPGPPLGPVQPRSPVPDAPLAHVGPGPAPALAGSSRPPAAAPEAQVTLQRPGVCRDRPVLPPAPGPPLGPVQPRSPVPDAPLAHVGPGPAPALAGSSRPPAAAPEAQVTLQRPGVCRDRPVLPPAPGPPLGPVQPRSPVPDAPLAHVGPGPAPALAGSSRPPAAAPEAQVTLQRPGVCRDRPVLPPAPGPPLGPVQPRSPVPDAPLAHVGPGPAPALAGSSRPPAAAPEAQVTLQRPGVCRDRPVLPPAPGPPLGPVQPRSPVPDAPLAHVGPGPAPALAGSSRPPAAAPEAQVTLQRPGVCRDRPVLPPAPGPPLGPVQPRSPVPDAPLGKMKASIPLFVPCVTLQRPGVCRDRPVLPPAPGPPLGPVQPRSPVPDAPLAHVGPGPAPALAGSSRPPAAAPEAQVTLQRPGVCRDRPVLPPAPGPPLGPVQPRSPVPDAPLAHVGPGPAPALAGSSRPPAAAPEAQVTLQRPGVCRDRPVLPPAPGPPLGPVQPRSPVPDAPLAHVGPGPAPALAGSSRPPAAAPEAQVTLQRPGVCRDRPVLPPAPGPPLGPVQPRSPVPDAPLAHVGPGPAPALAGSSRPPAAAPEAQVTLQRPGVCRDRPVLPPAPGPPLGPVQPRSPVPDAPLAHVGPGPAPALAGSSRPPAAAPEAQVTLQRPGVCRDRPVLPPAPGPPLGPVQPRSPVPDAPLAHVGPGPAPALAGSSRPPAAAPEAQVTLQRPGVCRDRPVLPPAPGPPLGPVQPRSPVPDAPLAHVGPGPAPALAGSSRPPAAAPEAQVTLQRPGVCRDRPVLPPAPGPPLGPVQPRSPVPDAPLVCGG